MLIASLLFIQRLILRLVILRKFSAVANGNSLGRSAGLRTYSFNLSDNLHAFLNFSEDNMLSIEPASYSGSDEELRSIFKSFDIGNKGMIFSCGSGLTSCILMLAAAQVMDNNSSVYDGSWTQWATIPELPIIKGK